MVPKPRGGCWSPAGAGAERSVLSLQMEDGHSLFDYSVGLNDIVQLLVRQSPAVLPAGSREKDPELSDTDSGCGSGPSESDKSSHNGEAALELEGQPGTAAPPDWAQPGFGLYKVGAGTPGAPSPLGTALCAAELLGISHIPLCGQSLSSSQALQQQRQKYQPTHKPIQCNML